MEPSELYKISPYMYNVIIWGKKCKILTRSIFLFSFHICHLEISQMTGEVKH